MVNMKWPVLVILLENVLSCSCQTSFTITRSESGDEVQSSMTSTEYCTAIHGYLDGSQCKCDFRRTFSLDSQKCIDYYNVPQFRFSRLGLNSDVSVSVVSIATGVDGVNHMLEFTASSSVLPIVQGTASTPLPTGCTVSSVEFNTYTGWIVQSFNGFSLAEHNSHVYLEVTELPSAGAEFFRAQFVRLSISCPSITGLLMFKFGSGSQTFTPSQSDPCNPNPCDNSGSCTANGNSFTCSCVDGFLGVSCQSTDYCANNSCQNNGSCVNGIGTHLCRCIEEFAGQSCETYVGDIEDRCDGDEYDNLYSIDDNSNRICSSFSIDRMDRGDSVNTPLSSVEYCSSIRAYCPDGSCSYCQCEFRLSYRHDLRRCDDYYNECSLRFSRLTLNVDTGVSTVGFAEDGDGGYEISFEATSYPLPIVQGTADYALPPHCVISSLAVNRATGWRTVDHGGFSLQYNGQDTFLEIDGQPSLGINFFNSEFVRLNISCLGRSLGCLPMKFSGSKTSTYSTDFCSIINPCNNGATCVSSDSSFTCNCAPNYSGLLCDDFDHCSSQPCQNGATCVNSRDSYTCNCPDGFEGIDCDHVTTSCEVDSCANGGTCSLNGDSITCNCVEGFTGAVCDEDVDDCVNNSCENGATCSDSGINSYTCICANGYSGEYCDINIDDCDPNHCRNGATCVDAVANFSCQCAEGFTGHLCHINNGGGCATKSCENGGTCIGGSDVVYCQCVSGFTGQQCETNIDDCSPNLCENNSTCTDGVNGFTCSCEEGFTGDNCNTAIDHCDPDPCQNGATCINGDLSFTCNCPEGFTGQLCDEVDDCVDNLCQNGATCVDGTDSYTCSCVDGFIDAFCQSTDYCASTSCQNNGSCVNGIGTHLCHCIEEFAGQSCETYVGDIEDHCDDDEYDNLNSIDDNGSRICSSFSIDRMDRGDSVNTPLSSVEYCSSIRAYCPDGSCSYCQCEFRLSYRHDLRRCDDYYNECSLRFSRLTLNVDTGVSTVSFAEDGDGGYEISFEATSYPLPIVQGTADYALPPHCVISSLAVNRAAGWRTVDHGGFSLHYSGQDAFLEIDGQPSLGINFFNSEFVRLNISCLGKIFGCLPMKFSGSKTSTYSTDFCSIINPCNNGATCVSGDSSFTCNCAPNYSGLLCDDFDHCSSQPCQNGATCANSRDSYTCNCPDGFEGIDCDHVTTSCEADSCANGGTCSLNGDSITCNCVEGFTGAVCDEDVDDCVNNSCENGATCSDSGINSYTCICANGYSGEYCDINIDDCDPNHCRNGATCVDAVANFSCQCAEGFTGHLCHINNGGGCATTSCENGGTCIGGSDVVYCQCVSGFTGQQCETNLDDCSPNPCENGGNCTDELNGFMCSCEEGFTGDNCNTTTDYCPCQNGATCTNSEASFCICPEGFTGQLCDEVDDCVDNLCQNGANCVDGTDSYTCGCADGYTGDYCETDSDDCAGYPCVNGNCTDQVNGYSCSCSDGYTGLNCDEDIDECVINPCNNGVCSNTDGSFVCNCTAGFMGEDCSEVVCYEGYCASGGSCSAGSTGLTCLCSQGFIGQRCETQDRAVTGRSTQDDSQTGTAVGVSVGLVVVLIAVAVLVIIAIMVYARYHVRSKQNYLNDLEQDEGMQNPTYGTNGRFMPTTDNTSSSADGTGTFNEAASTAKSE
ncbi:neurogenic locus notch homolog protein 1-like isoform X2 [Dysidea avara]|uniref:neurogenic locus notch homolog protein 1-like isoform X2 n=1 Tax=Dysidea avara TaxID=196820 RepID=UPI003329936B